MNILIIAHSSNLGGGANRSLLSIIEVLIKQHFNIVVFLPKRNGDMYKILEERHVKCEYVPFYQICYTKQSSPIINFKSAIVMYGKLVRDRIFAKIKSKSLKFDLVYTNTKIPFFGAFLAKDLKIPHVWHIREFISPYEVVPTRSYALMSYYTNKFILISQDLFDEYSKKIDKTKLVLIHNGIPLNKKKVKIAHLDFNIIIAGRIHPSKGQLDAIEAIKILYDQGIVDIHLYVAGNIHSQDYYQNIMKKIKEYRLEKNIVICGMVDNLDSLRSQMDIELMCACREAFGRVTVEAMRAGLPVIGTNSGGTKDIIKHQQNGYLYPPGDTVTLSNYVFALYSNRSLLSQFSNNAIEYSENNFTEKQFYKVSNVLKYLHKEIESKNE